MSHPTLLLCIPILPPLCFPSYHNHTHFPLSGVQHLSASIMLSPMSVHFYLLLIQSKFRPPHPASLKFEPVTDRMAVPELIRACMTRCSARLSAGLWERELLILVSGDGSKATWCLNKQAFFHYTHTFRGSCTQV